MAGITYFVALPFDFVDGGIAAGEPIKCSNPAAAIQSAEGLWKIFGHAGAVALAISRLANSATRMCYANSDRCRMI
jgi:hypothetical protein